MGRAQASPGLHSHRPHRGGKKSPPQNRPRPTLPDTSRHRPCPEERAEAGDEPLATGGVPATTTILSRDGADPHIPFRAPHTEMRRGSSLSRGVPQTLRPLRVPRLAIRQEKTHLRTSFLHTWLEEGGEVVTQSQPLNGVRATGPLPADGHPRPSHPSEWGDRPPSAKGSPRPSHSSVWGNGPSHTLMAEGGGSHSPTPLRGV